MSSVSSKTTSGQDEAVSKAREEYKRREAELIKKQNNEIRALNQKYAKDLDSRDRQHSEHLADARLKTQDVLTKKDVRYKNEMNDLRKMHTKQLEKLLQENRERLEVQAKTSQAEVKQANLGKKDRVEELNRRYEQQFAQENERFTNKLEELRENQRESVLNTRKQLEAEHKKEMEYLIDDRNEKVADLKNENRSLRQGTGERLRHQEARHLEDKRRTQDSHMETYRQQEVAHNDVQMASREAREDAVQSLRQETAYARQKDLDYQNKSSSDFREKIEGQVENQVNRLEQDLRKASDDNIMTRTQAQRQANREVASMRDAYQEKVDHLENARLETLRESNEINSSNIQKTKAEADKQMMDTSRYYRSRMEMENMKNKQALETAEREFALHQNYVAENADTRVNHVRQDTEKTVNSIRENYDSNLDLLKTTNEEDKRDIRLDAHKSAEARVASMKEQFQKQEVEHQRKQSDLVAKYEKRLTEVGDQFMKEKRLRDAREKRLVTELKRTHENEKEALRMKFEEQNKRANEHHGKELREVTKRNQEKIDEVLTSMKKS